MPPKNIPAHLKSWNKNDRRLKKQIAYHLSEHKHCNKSIPREQERIKRHKQAQDTLSKAYDKIDRFLKTASPRMGKGRKIKEVKSNIIDNESAKMTTSKGTIQGYNGVASVDKKHQIIIDAEAFGEGQVHHTLQPVLKTIKDRYDRLGVSPDLYHDGIVVTADTGFANEANMAYLHANNINGYIPDNKFRSRDPKFIHQKAKYGKRNSDKCKTRNMLPASEFPFDPTHKTCTCPADNSMWLHREGIDQNGNHKLFFEGRLSKCRHCTIKHQCMQNPASADTRKDHGRQVSFIIENKPSPRYTDWMKHRVDSKKGKLIYSHRMSVVEPVFGNIGTNKRLNRFSVRGKQKVQCQWQLYCMVHNIEKLANYGTLAA